MPVFKVPLRRGFSETVVGTEYCDAFIRANSLGHAESYVENHNLDETSDCSLEWERGDSESDNYETESEELDNPITQVNENRAYDVDITEEEECEDEEGTAQGLPSYTNDPDFF